MRRLLVVSAFFIYIALVSTTNAELVVEPFELSDVQLAENTFQYQAAASNQEYLLDLLDADRMLWVFRKNAGLPTPGVPFYGTWEDPGCELRGHFVGHWLSAVSFVVHNTGEACILGMQSMSS